MTKETVTRSANAARIERAITERTWGRVHRLDVEVTDHRIRVSGFTASYYIKQLTIQAILDVVGPDSSCRIDVDVDVGAAPDAMAIARSPSSSSRR